MPHVFGVMTVSPLTYTVLLQSLYRMSRDSLEVFYQFKSFRISGIYVLTISPFIPTSSSLTPNMSSDVEMAGIEVCTTVLAAVNHLLTAFSRCPM